MRTGVKAKARTSRSGRPTVPKVGGKKQWEKPKVTYLGRVDEVVRRGGGKLSIPTFDPGEPFRKPRGQDH